MEDTLSQFIELKISALSKAKFLSEYIDNVPLERKTTYIVKPTSVIGAVTKDEEKCSTAVEKEDVYARTLSGLELKRRRNVREAVNLKKRQLEANNREVEKRRHEEWSRTQRKMVIQMQDQEAHILHALEQHDKDSLRHHEQLVKYYQELAEKREENDRAIREKEENNQKIMKIIDQVYGAQQEFREIYLEIIHCLKDCDETVKDMLKECIKNLKTLPQQMDEIVNKCKAATVSDPDGVKCKELLQSAVTYRNEIIDKVIVYNNQKVAELSKNEPPPPVVVEEKTIAQQETATPVLVPVNTIESFVSKNAFKTYSELQLFQQSNEDMYKPLLDNASLKTFKFDCKKAVNIPVNALSARADHLSDKYNKLHALLAGKPVQIGDSQLTASTHPQGVLFCTDLLAKKFVLQGDLMISGNPDAAFYYSSIIISLWNDFPNFGKLLLARFHQSCPCTVPIYLPRTVGQSDEEYYSNLGYLYKDGAVEKQDKFLKRMTGIFRLYFSILITKPRRSQRKSPHDLTNGWKWFVNVLNLEPRTDITATGILVFLEVIGWAMEKSYGKQFQKLVHYVMNGYMEKLRMKDSGGPVARLEQLLQNYKNKGCFERPRGILPDNYW